ncbi:hypothetical protein [Micromonospora sp. ATA51]|uniref:hypothetical protein n=1 Tax=Micromonospora sp. ATA51 TaxID=2806098 RepID=UPI001A448630|nr:hypothetical protein [Micromonospora sp. ATA51]MBM0226721.1 recombinase family protein [Micromonospora sp. ATA51]
MNLKQWAEREGVHQVGTYRWFREGKLPVPARRVGQLILRDPAVTTIVVEHRDRFVRFGAEYVEAALAAQGRRLLVVEPPEVDGDLVRDVTEILTSLRAHLYRRWDVADRVRRAVEAATGDEPA